MSFSTTSFRAEIPKQNYVLYNKGSYTSRIIEQYFREEEMVLNTVIELGSMDAIKELVKLGLGVSIVAPWIAAKELQEKSVAAHRNKVSDVIIPHGNARDIEELPEEVRATVRFHPVKTMDEVLALALRVPAQASASSGMRKTPSFTPGIDVSWWFR